MKAKKSIKWLRFGIAGGLVMLLTAGLLTADYYNLLPKKAYCADDFGIATLHSRTDYNANGVDDYTDFLLGARRDAENHPQYDGAYYDGGYPPEDIGVCTDVVWRAFRAAGCVCSWRNMPFL